MLQTFGSKSKMNDTTPCDDTHRWGLRGTNPFDMEVFDEGTRFIRMALALAFKLFAPEFASPHLGNVRARRVSYDSRVRDCLTKHSLRSGIMTFCRVDTCSTKLRHHFHPFIGRRSEHLIYVCAPEKTPMRLTSSLRSGVASLGATGLPFTTVQEQHQAGLRCGI